MVASHYDHIWDCCCDHGLLGCALLAQQANGNIPNHIHFVDIVPELMDELDKKLHRFYSDLAWRTHCLDVAKLPLIEYKGKQLIVIAGVGGDLMIEFIESIYQQHKSMSIDFLLCPVHHQYALRQKLIDLDFSMKDEVLVEDNQRFYEVILVSTTRNQMHKINPVGNKIWQPESQKQAEIAEKYLHKTLNHYQRIHQGSHQSHTNKVQHIIDAYNEITF
jgi:tRNA (adenine22-N1)-methyltransferase